MNQNEVIERYKKLKNNLDDIMTDFDEFINLFNDSINKLNTDFRIDKEVFNKDQIYDVKNNIIQIKSIKKYDIDVIINNKIYK